jgi:hypothetical protein
MSSSETTNLPINSPNAVLIRKEPENSVVTRILVNYDSRDYTTGFKFFNAEGFCVM